MDEARERADLLQQYGVRYAVNSVPSAAITKLHGDERDEAIAPDVGRAILHFDVDCFYAQVEELNNPELRGRPLGVTQKYLVVTCNYAARERGVTKLMSTADALRACPSLVLVSGEDLTPYRAASKRISAILSRFGPTERLGLDEVWVDATAEAERRARDSGAPHWHGVVHSVQAAPVHSDNLHRPMDLRAAPPAAGQLGAEASGAPGPSGSGQSRPHWEALLRIGSAIAAEARAAVKAEAGFVCSAGVASNKQLSKMAAGLHKPNGQTVLPPPEAAAFVAPLPVRALPGVGFKVDRELAALGVTTCAQLRDVPLADLVARFGERVAAMLDGACRGKDCAAVRERGPSAAISVEDSFRPCSSRQAPQVLARLAPDLLARLREEHQEWGRRPAVLVLKWRHKDGGRGRRSASCPMPPTALSPRSESAEQAQALCEAAQALLRRHLPEPVALTLLSLGASGFSTGAGAATAGAASIADLLGCARAAAGSLQVSASAQSGGVPSATQGTSSQAGPAPGPAAAGMGPRLAPPSKREQREMRERLAGAGPQQPAASEAADLQRAGEAAARDLLGAPARGCEGDPWDEEDDSRLWSDLRSLHCWQHRNASEARAGGLEPRRPAAVPSAACPVPRAGPGERAAAPLPSRGHPQQGAMAHGLLGVACAADGSSPPARPAPKRGEPVASYRNAEALALRAAFSVGAAWDEAALRAALADPGGSSAEEQASLELAVRLQRKEAEASRSKASRAAPDAKRPRSGPMDSFVRRL